MKNGKTTDSVVPPVAELRLGRDKLEGLWLDSDCRTLKEFARRYCLDKRAFRRRSLGWAKKRRLMRREKRAGTPNPTEVRQVLLKHWWEVIWRLDGCFGSTDTNADELKLLSSIAAVLKAAQAGMDQLLTLEEERGATGLVIEGVNVEML